MTVDPERPPLAQRLDLRRLVIGSVLEWLAKAWGAGAALAVALGDADTLWGKLKVAVKAYPTLAEEVRQARYVAEHRVEIQGAVDYVSRHTPDQAELEQSVEQTSETLRGISTTYAELDEAFSIPPPLDAFSHLKAAWDARPSTDSLRDLADAAEQASPYVDQTRELVPLYHSGLLSVMDNFASDEIAATLFAMGAALAFGLVAGHVIGFWVRRGRPGWVASVLQGWGASRFRDWYLDNLPRALGPRLYAVSREHFERELLGRSDEPRGPC
ncbi:MAG: hypothetical protein LT071_02130 [Nocardioides sp.]|nr:hypothetical protein [Nocardioides sp.]